MFRCSTWMEGISSYYIFKLFEMQVIHKETNILDPLTKEKCMPFGNGSVVSGREAFLKETSFPRYLFNLAFQSSLEDRQ